MFAILKSGGKQHRIQVGDEFKVERLPDDSGSQILLQDVIMLGTGGDVTIGRPFVKGAGVAVEIIEHARDKKIIVFKRKRRQNYRRTNGHRQHYSLLKVLDIMTDSSKFDPKKLEVKATVKKAGAKKVTAKKPVAAKQASV